MHLIILLNFMNVKSTGQNLICERVTIENAKGLIQAVKQSKVKKIHTAAEWLQIP